MFDVEKTTSDIGKIMSELFYDFSKVWNKTIYVNKYNRVILADIWLIAKAFAKLLFLAKRQNEKDL